MSKRTVREMIDARREDMADLVTRRPHHDLEAIEPFLFINHHGPQLYPPNNRGLPFGPHPHRGFETVTFIVEGALQHTDSAGHESVIDAGGVQWMTAGSGVEHNESAPADFRRSGGPLEVLQLWVNLPSRLKMTTPRYVGLQRADIPVIQADERRAAVSLIAGEWNGQRGPIDSLTGVFLSTIQMHAGATLTLPAPRERTVFLYVVRGEVEISGTPARMFQLAEMHDDGDEIELRASTDALVIFGHATPNREPIVAYGPFVMNTSDEIRQAIMDDRAGAFRR